MPDRGVTIVLTRRREDSQELTRTLGERGADVLVMPCVRSEPLADTRALSAALTSLGASDLLVLTSRAGAEAVAPFAPAAPVAAVGPATARRARALGLRVAFVPAHADGATLARELPLPAGQVLFARSDLAEREPLDILRARGARVREVVAYRTVPGLKGDAAALVAALERGRVAILLASPSAVRALSQAIGAGPLAAAALVAIGPRTRLAVRQHLGLDAIVARAGDLAGALLAAASRKEALVP